MEDNFQENNARLSGDRVMVPYDPARETRVYTDSGPEGAVGSHWLGTRRNSGVPSGCCSC